MAILRGIEDAARSRFEGGARVPGGCRAMKMVPVSFYCESYLLVDGMRVDCAEFLVLVARHICTLAELVACRKVSIAYQDLDSHV